MAVCTILQYDANYRSVCRKLLSDNIVPCSSKDECAYLVSIAGA